MTNPVTQRDIRTRRRRRTILNVVVMCFSVWLLGLLVFLTYIPPTQDTPPSADAVAVLTGGAGRIEAGLALMKDGKAPRMLISGVHDSVQIADLAQTYPDFSATLACCVTLGRAAHDTPGNAAEIANWARTNGLNHLLIVTADYHAPRTRILVRGANPDLVLTYIPVRSGAGLRHYIFEYHKFLFTLVGMAVGL